MKDWSISFVTDLEPQRSLFYFSPETGGKLFLAAFITQPAFGNSYVVVCSDDYDITHHRR